MPVVIYRNSRREEYFSGSGQSTPQSILLDTANIIISININSLVHWYRNCFVKVCIGYQTGQFIEVSVFGKGEAQQHLLTADGAGYPRNLVPGLAGG
jgi:hypothetical protein